MKPFAFVLSVLLAILLAAALVEGRRVRGLRPVSEQYPVETVHSLTPGNVNQVYYNTGGSAVLTQKGVRLVPAVSGKSGWLWNEYPIEYPNFEMEIKFEIHSKPHFGGDGMAIWFVKGNSDPSFYTNPTAIDGPVMGMNDDFQGIGIIIDTYDNDGRRNNPSIFAIKNSKRGETFRFNPELDFEGQMVTDIHKGSHRCVNDLRNTNRPVEMVIKVIHNSLFVYINSHASTGYRSCLSVNLALEYDHFATFHNLKGHHIAITASTGQVSDNIDIESINVRYLKSDNTDVDPSAFIRSLDWDYDWYDVLMYLANVGLAIFLLYTTHVDYTNYTTGVQNHIDAVIICKQLNETVQLQFWLTCALAVLLLIAVRLLPLIVIAPITIIRLIFEYKGLLYITPGMVAQFAQVYSGNSQRSGSGILGLSLNIRYMLAYVTFSIIVFLLAIEYFFDISWP